MKYNKTQIFIKALWTHSQTTDSFNLYMDKYELIQQDSISMCINDLLRNEVLSIN